MVKTRIDPKKCRALLSRALPAVIKTKEENEQMLAAVERPAAKAEDKLTPEEGRMFKLMVRMIEGFDESAYPIPKAAISKRGRIN